MSKPSTANGGYPNVVVTALAATTSVAPDIEGTWKALLAGESGIRVLEDDFVTKWDLQVKIGGHLKEPIDDHMSRLDLRRMSYVQRLAKYLSGQLWESAGNPEVDPDRFSVVVAYCSDLGERTKQERDRDRKSVSRWSRQLDDAFEQETPPSELIDFLKEEAASKTKKSKARKPKLKKPRGAGLSWGPKPSR